MKDTLIVIILLVSILTFSTWNYSKHLENSQGKLNEIGTAEDYYLKSYIEQEKWEQKKSKWEKWEKWKEEQFDTVMVQAKRERQI